MKKTLSLLTAIILSLSIISCNKTSTSTVNTIPCEEDTTVAPEAEKQYLRNYMTEYNITATEDPKGYFYIIDSVGTGDKIQKCNTITCTYNATLLDGSYIDNGINIVLMNHTLIKGWQQGVTHIGVGGKITLFIPPSLAYGKQGRPPAIGSDEYLKFVISVSKVTNTNP